MSALPPCGLYRTKGPLGSVPAGQLVFFHNHGDPGPGLYLPTGWVANRAQFAASGVPVERPDTVAAQLEPLPEQGLYRVMREFYCCEKRCRRFEPELLVQLGYNGAGDAILFAPEWIEGSLAFPERGFPIDAERFKSLSPLKVAIVKKVPSDQVH
jgi:hypothetical protein